MAKKTFLGGAAILGVAGLLVQVMGAVLRIPLANIIGEEGMGYYQTAYPIYIFLLVFSTNGAPAAISKMASERIAVGEYAEAHRVFRLSFMLMGVFGLVAFLAVLLLARPLVELFHNPGAYYAMVAISPALLFVPIMSVFRGYYQGMQEMRPTAVSQLAEQAVRVFSSLALAVLLMQFGLEAAAAGASLGASIGPVAGVLILIAIYVIRKHKIFEKINAEEKMRTAKRKKESAGDLLKTLAALAIPTTIGVSILPIMNVVDVAICMGRLQAGGFTQEEANSYYGLMSGFAAPIINIPMALALSIALSLIPAVAAAKSTGDRAFFETNLRMGLRTAMLIGVPCSFGLIILSGPILRLIYPMQEESGASAALCLTILASGVIFLSIAQTMAGILQGLGRPSLPVIALGLGVVVKAAATWFLTPTALNINGAAIGSVMGYIVIAFANIYYVKKQTGVRFDGKLAVAKPIVCGIIMGIVATIIYNLVINFVGNSLSTIVAVALAAAAYGLAVLKFGAITADELAHMPKGDKIVKLLHKVKLV